MTTPANDVLMPSQYFGAFIQDDWRPLAKLTLNLGLRYDLQIGAFNTDVRPDQFRIPIPIIDPSVRGDGTIRSAARIRYDATGDGATVVRGGYGVYYDNIRMLSQQYEKLNMLRYNIRITNPAYPTRSRAAIRWSSHHGAAEHPRTGQRLQEPAIAAGKPRIDAAAVVGARRTR